MLGTLENTYGYNTIVNAIIAADPVIHDTPNYLDGSYLNYDGNYNLPYSGAYTLSAKDFNSDGSLDWWAAQAFVHYLDIIDYAGSNQWALPTQPDQIDVSIFTNSPLGELYFNELNALAWPGTNFSDYGILHDGSMGTSGNAGPFANAQTDLYWFGTELNSYPDTVWRFGTDTGYQYGDRKYGQSYAWAISPGQLTAVPVPSAIGLFGASLLGLLGLKRNGHAS